MPWRARPAVPALLLALLATGLPLARADDAEDDDERATVETVVVTANRIAEPANETAVSVTAVGRAELERADLRSTAQAAELAPNARLVDFTARAVSNPQFRGIGGSTTNPGVTTYLDGVPQLSGDTSSQELLDVERIELVRGAQGTLYGRNTLGGVLNVTSIAPTPSWGGRGELTFGDFARRDLRAALGGPLFDTPLGVRLAYGESTRDGYSTNTVTGDRLDDRAARFYALKLGGDGDGGFGARLIARGESANDGDFALGDLAALRANPDRVSHDFQGRTQRDLNAQTLDVHHRGDSLAVESITGFVDYRAAETTDLDATAEPDLTRTSVRDGWQLTQELRVATRDAEPLGLGTTWGGQAGVFGFLHDDAQDTTNFIAPAYLLESGGIAVPPALRDLLNERFEPAQDRTRAVLDDGGVGLYAQATLGFLEQWEATAGLRYDLERKHADIDSVTALELPGGELPLVEPVAVNDTRSFQSVSPRAILSFAPLPEHRVYVSAARGYRAGGFNALAPADSIAYGEEWSWAYELGAKSTFLAQRVETNLAFFRVELDDLQLNVPLAGAPGRYYIDNTGHARSQGIELEARARPIAGLSIDAALGVLDARFGAGSRYLGEDVGGNRLPFADELTVFLAATYERTLGEHWRIGVRGEWIRRGDYFYEAANTERLAPYDLFDAAVWLGYDALSVRLFGRNLGDERVIPLAIPFTTPSGFVGEAAPPRTLGVSVALEFR
ncbi:MAG: TonB-dependent receptor [bacterium]